MARSDNAGIKLPGKIQERAVPAMEREAERRGKEDPDMNMKLQDGNFTCTCTGKEKAEADMKKRVSSLLSYIYETLSDDWGRTQFIKGLEMEVILIGRAAGDIAS